MSKFRNKMTGTNVVYTKLIVLQSFCMAHLQGTLASKSSLATTKLFRKHDINTTSESFTLSRDHLIFLFRNFVVLQYYFLNFQQLFMSLLEPRSLSFALPPCKKPVFFPENSYRIILFWWLQILSLLLLKYIFSD